MNYTTYLASTYGSGSYDSSQYGGQTTGQNTSQGSGASGGGVLANTGFDVLLAVTLACIILCAAIIVRVYRRPAKPKS